MKKSIAFGIILLFILSTVSSMAVGFDISTTSKKIVNKESNLPIIYGNILYVGGSGPGNYTSIQAAINDTNPGDSVFVYNGIYYESIVINKTINLLGEDRNNTIIDGGGIGDVVYVPADWVNITGFTIQNSGSHSRGIFTNSNFNYFSYNNIFYTLHGIYVGSYNHNNTIIGNNASNNHNGIRVHYSNDNKIIGNNANSNNWAGINIAGSSGNMVIDNNANSNNDRGISLKQYSNSNKVIGNNVNSNTERGIFIAYYSNSNIVTGNNANSNGDGIHVDYCSYTLITGNNFNSNNIAGIYLVSSTRNTINGNNASNNEYGIELWNSVENILYHNNLINSRWNDGFDNSLNIWYNSTLQEGNYYDDYTGTDYDGDGKGDTPYYVYPGSSQDLYPFMNPNGWLNVMPYAPIIEGPQEGKIGIEYHYNFSLSDPDNDSLYLRIDWGNGTIGPWIGPYNSDTIVRINHTWNKHGTFTIRAQVKDSYGVRSNWTYLDVTMPKNKMMMQRPFWFRFLERFPILQLLLNILREVNH